MRKTANIVAVRTGSAVAAAFLSLMGCSGRSSSDSPVSQDVQQLWEQIETAGASCGTGMARAQTILRTARRPERVSAEDRGEIERIHESCVAAAGTIRRMTPPPSIGDAASRSRMQQAIASCADYRGRQQAAVGHVLAILRSQGDPQHHLAKIQSEQSRFSEAMAGCRDSFAAAAAAAGAAFDVEPGNRSS